MCSASRNLRKTYDTSDQHLRRRRSYQVRRSNEIEHVGADRGMTLAIVGESGCGKSTFAKVLTGLELGDRGHVTLDGKEIGQIAVEDRDRSRSRRKLQMVFQNPDSTLNPSHSVGYAMSARSAARPEAPCEGAPSETERSC